MCRMLSRRMATTQLACLLSETYARVHNQPLAANALGLRGIISFTYTAPLVRPQVCTAVTGLCTADMQCDCQPHASHQMGRRLYLRRNSVVFQQAAHVVLIAHRVVLCGPHQVQIRHDRQPAAQLRRFWWQFHPPVVLQHRLR
jgi:hypothetical protein